MRRWLLAALPLFLLPACTPRKDQAPRASDARGAAGPAAVQPSKELALSKQPPASPRAAAPFVPLEQTLPALPFPPLLPEDFDLGPLTDRMAGGREEREAAEAADRFLTELAYGKVPAEALLAERREQLADSLSYYLQQGLRPVWHRLGRLTMEKSGAEGERSACIEVRLRGDAGGSRGELYLIRVQGRWVVSDVQIGLALLAQPEARREGKFVPSGYRGRLE